MSHMEQDYGSPWDKFIGVDIHVILNNALQRYRNTRASQQRESGIIASAEAAYRVAAYR